MSGVATLPTKSDAGHPYATLPQHFLYFFPD